MLQLTSDKTHRPRRLARPLLTLFVAFTVAACASIGPSRPANITLTVPAEVLNPDVHQDNIQQTICVAGYTATVRPSSSFTYAIKMRLLREQGLPESDAKLYELDHIVPLALGGHPRNLHNLMLQPWKGADGAKAKDKLERHLQLDVCHGAIGLREAQELIFRDWKSALQHLKLQ